MRSSFFIVLVFEFLIVVVVSKLPTMQSGNELNTNNIQNNNNNSNNNNKNNNISGNNNSNNKSQNDDSDYALDIMLHATEQPQQHLQQFNIKTEKNKVVSEKRKENLKAPANQRNTHIQQEQQQQQQQQQKSNSPAQKMFKSEIKTKLQQKLHNTNTIININTNISNSNSNNNNNNNNSNSKNSSRATAGSVSGIGGGRGGSGGGGGGAAAGTRTGMATQSGTKWFLPHSFNNPFGQLAALFGSDQLHLSDYNFLFNAERHTVFQLHTNNNNNNSNNNSNNNKNMNGNSQRKARKTTTRTAKIPIAKAKIDGKPTTRKTITTPTTKTTTRTTTTTASASSKSTPSAATTTTKTTTTTVRNPSYVQKQLNKRSFSNQTTTSTNAAMATTKTKTTTTTTTQTKAKAKTSAVGLPAFVVGSGGGGGGGSGVVVGGIGGGIAEQRVLHFVSNSIGAAFGVNNKDTTTTTSSTSTGGVGGAAAAGTGGTLLGSTVTTATGTTAGVNAVRVEEVQLYNAASLRQSRFNPFNPTRIIVHGWFGGSHAGVFQSLVPEYLKLGAGNYNVFTVDWGRGAVADYLTASYRVKPVGKVLAKFIDFLHAEAGMRFEDLQLIGFSMGAHIAGIAGKHVQTGRVPLIYALDPALPFFRYDAYDERLSITDAAYVEVIHTNAGAYGYDRPLGHVDFYVNYGNQQPGCFFNECSHMRAYQLFAESLHATEPPFRGIGCDVQMWADMMRQRRCLMPTGLSMLMGGDSKDVQKLRGRGGVYSVATNAISPYVRHG